MLLCCAGPSVGCCCWPGAPAAEACACGRLCHATQTADRAIHVSWLVGFVGRLGVGLCLCVGVAEAAVGVLMTIRCLSCWQHITGSTRVRPWDWNCTTPYQPNEEHFSAVPQAPIDSHSQSSSAHTLAKQTLRVSELTLPVGGTCSQVIEHVCMPVALPCCLSVCNQSCGEAACHTRGLPPAAACCHLPVHVVNPPFHIQGAITNNEGQDLFSSTVTFTVPHCLSVSAAFSSGWGGAQLLHGASSAPAMVNSTPCA